MGPVDRERSPLPLAVGLPNGVGPRRSQVDNRRNGTIRASNPRSLVRVNLLTGGITTSTPGSARRCAQAQQDS